MPSRGHFFRFALLAAGLIAALAAPAAAETRSIMVGVNRNMTASLIAPDGPGPFPGMFLLHTSGGLSQDDIAYAERLSAQGYVVLVPAFLAAYGIDARMRRDTFTRFADPILADFVAAIDTLRQSPKVAGGKIGAIGFSNGGYFAMWLAAIGKVQAGASYYGALTGAGSDIGLDRFRQAFTAKSSPVLILHGSADSTVPVGAAQHLANIVEAVHAPFELHVYPGAEHRFERSDGTADKAAAADAWTRTLAFLAKTLKQP